MEGLVIMMNIDVLTIFPEMFSGVLGQSMLKKAAEKQVLFTTMLSIFAIMLIINIKQWMIILMVAVLGWS